MRSMGCFPVPKHKSKVAAASQQADQLQSQNKNRCNGAKLELLLSSNKPVLLPDPDDLPGEQPPRPGTISAPARIRGGILQQEPERGSVIAQVPTTAGPNIIPSTRLINHLPRALSAPVSYASLSRDDLPALPAYSSNSSVPFSAPLSSPLPVETSGSPSLTGLPDTNRSSQYPGLDKRVSSAFHNEKKRVLYSGRPLRLPKSAAISSNARPLPLPHPPDLDEATVSGMTGGFPVGFSITNSVTRSPNQGNDGYGPFNPGHRSLSIGGGNIGEAMPLPPPALPTQSRTPVRAFLYGELAHSLVPECLICEGVFGRAYRASVDEDGEDGEDASVKTIEVAVVCPALKSLQGPKEWMAEVTWLARLQDSHLCKLIGYCAEDIPGLGSKRLLVYEFMGNESLDRYKEGSLQLNWSSRMRVALDIAQGLSYLHNKAPFQVISRDLGSLSIQLDKDHHAKLSGFGLARCGPEGDLGSIMAGPYVAPESSLNGLVTIKSNAWSFGVMLLELLTGRKHMDPSVPSGQQNLIQLTKPFLRDEGKLFLIMDPELNGRYSGRGSMKMASLAFQCLFKEASLRPNLSEAVEVLKVIQTDEESLAFELKKSRSLSQSVGSPVSYGRSTGDGFVQQTLSSSSLNSSPSSDPKLRDREFLKLSNLGSVSPSYFESKLSSDPKYNKRGLGDQDPQLLPTSAQQPFDSRQTHLESNHQKEKVATQFVDPSVQIASTQLNENKHWGPRKVLSGGAVSFMQSVNDRKAIYHSLQGAEIRRSQLANAGALLSDADIKYKNFDTHKVLLQGQLQGAQCSEFKQQNQGCQVVKTPHSTACVQHGEKKFQNFDVQKLPNVLISSMLPISGEITSAESRTFLGPLPNSDNHDQQLSYGTKLLAASKPIDSVTLSNNARQHNQPTAAHSHEMPSETIQQHEQEMQKSSSARSSGSSRSSCAPALTFEPPRVREEFCVW